MVPGWDKNPPPKDDPYRYEPDIGSGGRIVLLAIIGFLLFASLGWVFIG